MKNTFASATAHQQILQCAMEVWMQGGQDHDFMTAHRGRVCAPAETEIISVLVFFEAPKPTQYPQIKKHQRYANLFEKFAWHFAFFPVTQVRNPTEIVQKNLFRWTFLFWMAFSDGFSSSNFSVGHKQCMVWARYTCTHCLKYPMGEHQCQIASGSLSGCGAPFSCVLATPSSPVPGSNLEK